MRQSSGRLFNLPLRYCASTLTSASFVVISCRSFDSTLPIVTPSPSHNHVPTPVSHRERLKTNNLAPLQPSNRNITPANMVFASLHAGRELSGRDKEMNYALATHSTRSFPTTFTHYTSRPILVGSEGNGTASTLMTFDCSLGNCNQALEPLISSASSSSTKETRLKILKRDGAIFHTYAQHPVVKLSLPSDIQTVLDGNHFNPDNWRDNSIRFRGGAQRFVIWSFLEM